MSTFGPLLRHTREQRGVSLDAVARETRLSKRYLIALEEETIGKLPGGNYNRAYLRSYARFLGLDPEGLLRDYLQLEARLTETAEADQLAAMNRALERRGALIAEASGNAGSASSLLKGPMVAGGVVVAGLIAAGGAVWVAVAGLDRVSAPAIEIIRVSEAPPAAEPVPPPTTAVIPAATPEARPLASTGTARKSPPPPLERPATNAPAPAAPGNNEDRDDNAGDVSSARAARLSVAGSGVGTGVVDRQLVGQADHFSPGSTVVFWTHVRGGRTGDTIDHVWFHDGTLIGAASLSVGSPDWRTQSRRVLEPGGVWTVEARDPEGHVLARHEIRTSDE